MRLRLSPLTSLASLAVLGAAAWAGLQEEPTLAARLEVAVIRGDTGKTIPARVYLFKDGRPFRLSPVDAMLPLRVDSFYRERVWRRGEGRPRTLEVTHDGDSHFILLDGHAEFSLPAGSYRLEAHHGFALTPGAIEFDLQAGVHKRIEPRLEPVVQDATANWLSGDDHVHLVRDREDDPLFLAWLQAEDLSVGNFLQLQRQVDAAAQYGFGPEAEARAPGFSIRSGQESRSAFYGHINLLGPRELLRPLSIGRVYANSPEAYPFPSVLFRSGRELGATVGFAHFDGSMEHSALPMDLALGNLDFIEVFQFGVLKSEPWYEVLNAGFRVTGVAGSDFPAFLPRMKPYPRAIPLLGPERTLARVEGAVEGSAYELWAEAVRRGRVVVSNGPILELTVDGKEPGSTLDWKEGSTVVEVKAEAWFSRPIEGLEVVANGKVVAAQRGDGEARRIALSAKVPLTESTWIAARVRGEKAEGEPDRQAHANPVYVLKDGVPAYVPEARAAILRRWLRDVDYYKGDALAFAKPEHRQELMEKLEETTRILSRPPERGGR
ncbi:MAG: CehA/McbA family metallohydrolase [Isosphaeraceae bacterium]